MRSHERVVIGLAMLVVAYFLTARIVEWLQHDSQSAWPLGTYVAACVVFVGTFVAGYSAIDTWIRARRRQNP